MSGNLPQLQPTSTVALRTIPHAPSALACIPFQGAIAVYRRSNYYMMGVCAMPNVTSLVVCLCVCIHSRKTLCCAVYCSRDRPVINSRSDEKNAGPSFTVPSIITRATANSELAVTPQMVSCVQLCMWACNRVMVNF